MARIFISYHSADAPFADQLLPLLERVLTNDSVWSAKYIGGGEDWWQRQRIISEIGRGDLFIALVSDSALASENWQAEYREALRLNKLRLSVIVQPDVHLETAPDDLQTDIRRPGRINMSGGLNDVVANANLYSAIHVLLGQVKSEPAPTPESANAQAAAAPKTDRNIPLAPIISAVAVVLAALIGLVPPILNSRNNAASVASVSSAVFEATATHVPTTAVAPTDTPTVTITPTPSPTPTETVTPTETPTPTLAPTATPTPVQIIVSGTPVTVPPVTKNDEWKPLIQSFDGVDMALVPPGCFDMGDLRGWPNEQPVKNICFDQPFWIDKTAVTQAQFKQFHGVAGHEFAYIGDTRPACCVTWFQASDFCAKRDARLPTEAEWEFAARGPDDLIYPWGNDFDPAKVIGNRNQTQGSGPVGTLPDGASWVGALDMSGDVSQWTSTLYRPYPYVADDGREKSDDTQSQRVIRGSGWSFTDSFAFRSSARFYDTPDKTYSTLSIRCVRDA